MIVLSHFQIKPLLVARKRGELTAVTSPDLGLTSIQVPVQGERITFADGASLSWEDAEEITEQEVACFALEGDTIRKIQAFSDVTNRHCSLMPTESAPTILIAGFPMHRIKGTNPFQDTLTKIKAANPTGAVLDTSMGLGYTAIQAAHTAEKVITIELDPAVMEVARQNPWSRELFASPKIERRIADSFDEVSTFRPETFARIIHDPPTMQLAGDLYSGEFYRELHRILKPNGRLFHYIGDLESPFGARVAKGVIDRLGKAGFRSVTRRNEAFGVVAVK
ncbi:MAG: spermine synthase [Chloroflexi bacterium]|uniref:methyltransferase domain-containing protein n=1 Tax=Candidatus Flexifilum breve TaxID=3140694 RepID=UPI00313722B9|nr:spermine synthase [Chloroflexota bacterium]